MRPDGRHGELQRLARAQWNVLKLVQIHEAGFSVGQVKRLHSSGVIHQRFKGIYTYGTDWLPPKGVLLAAQWSVGADAYLTCRTALGLARVCGQFLRRIEIAVPRRTVRARQPPVFLTRTKHPPDRLRHDGPLRYAPVERAILDLSAQGASVEQQKRLITDAVHQQRLDHRAMLELIESSAGQPGISTLTEAYHSYIPDPDAKHRLELSFDTGMRTRPWIPEPAKNVYLSAGGVRWELDRYWLEQRVLVELHGGGHHHADVDLEKDTFKAVKLGLIGIQILPITGTRWELEPDRCLDDLEAGLLLRGWRRP
jgi:hypothetical protein